MRQALAWIFHGPSPDLPCQQAVRARSYPHPPRANLVVVFGIAKNVRLAPEALDYTYYIFIYLYSKRQPAQIKLAKSN